MYQPNVLYVRLKDEPGRDVGIVLGHVVSAAGWVESDEGGAPPVPAVWVWWPDGTRASHHPDELEQVGSILRVDDRVVDRGPYGLGRVIYVGDYGYVRVRWNSKAADSWRHESDLDQV